MNILPENEEKIFNSFRVFSKDRDGKRRKSTLEAIKSTRREYFVRQEEARNKLGELVALAEAKKIDAEQARNDLQGIDREIQEASRSFIMRIINKIKIKRLEAELGSAKINEEIIAQELSEWQTGIMGLKSLLQDHSALEDARSKLGVFYEEGEKAWNEYKEDRLDGNVKRVMRDEGVFLVHAFTSPAISPSEVNGLVRKELSWKERLDILAALEPTISASAVDKDHERTFAPVGVLLANGQIEAASARDMASVALSLQERDVMNNFSGTRIKDQIAAALDFKNGQIWNEFVVSSPKIAGIFFKVETDGFLGDLESGSDAAMADIVSFAEERGLPLFAMKGGEFYTITAEEALELDKRIITKITELDEIVRYGDYRVEYKKFDLLPDRKVTGENVADLPESISKEQRIAIFEKVMSDSPFQLKRFPEASQIAARAEGRSIYHLYSAKEEMTADKKKIKIPAGAVGNASQIEATILSTIPGPTHWQHYVKLADGKLAIWYQNRKAVGGKALSRVGGWYHPDILVNKEQEFSLRLQYSYIQTEKPPQSVAEIIEAGKKSIDYLKKIEENEGKDKNLYSEMRHNDLKNITFALYGMAEEAKSMGDNATVELIHKTVGGTLPEEEYKDVIDRRVSESGTFKLTPEELTGRVTGLDIDTH